MKILIINGPNLNMLKIREPELYGDKSYKDLIKSVKTHAKKTGVKVRFFQSNGEGEIITAIQKAYRKFDGIIINAGGYTHTSVAIADAIKAVGIRTVEVHLTDIEKREDFRKFSYVSLVADFVIKGLGIDGYNQAINYLSK